MEDVKVRAAIKLGHHTSLRETLALALEVGAVQQLRKVYEEIKDIKSSFKRGSRIMCYTHKKVLQLSCSLTARRC